MIYFKKRVCFEKIKIGEVFGYIGCAGVGIKTTADKFMVLAHIQRKKDYHSEIEGDMRGTGNLKRCEVYRLPKSVQQLWRQ